MTDEKENQDEQQEKPADSGEVVESTDAPGADAGGESVPSSPAVE